MKRREFITLLGSSAVWPLAANGQQPAMPVIGFVRNTTLATAAHLVAAFQQGLKESGFTEGENVAVEYYSAEGQPDRLPSVVSDVIHRPVTAIAANGIAALAAKAATTTIPIVFATGGDPIEQGLVASLNRPEGNVTGVNFFDGALGTKRLELLHQLVPKAAIIGMLVNANTTETDAERRDVQTAAQAMGQQLLVIDVNSEHDIDPAFTTFVPARRGGSACRNRCIYIRQSGTTRRASGSSRIADVPYPPRGRAGRRPDELRDRHSGRVPSSRRLRWSDPKGRKACRFARYAIYQI
jgi:putative ABC transport system substrate-binding protein